ncbi:PHP domain-containing protein [Naumannella huperziae]
MRIDLHTHSAVSDGTDAPADLIAAAAAAGLDVVALTDHDTFDGLAEAAGAARRLGIGFVPGMEMSARRDGASVHLLAYGADPAHPALAAELARIRSGRADRVGPVLERLAALGVRLTREQVEAQAGGASAIGRPHIADALVAAGYVADRTEAFDRWLRDGGPAHVDRYATELARAIDLVHDAGGRAVLAHPWARESRTALPPEVITALVAEHGLDGLEADHHDHDEEARAELHALAARLGIVATGSSDHHGTGKIDHDLGSCTTSPAAYRRLFGGEGSAAEAPVQPV